MEMRSHPLATRKGALFSGLALFLILGVSLSIILFRTPSVNKKWSFQTDGVVNPPAVANGIVYVVSSGGQVDALDAPSGDKKWSYPIDGIHTSPAVVNGILYVGSYGGELYAIQLP